MKRIRRRITAIILALTMICSAIGMLPAKAEASNSIDLNGKDIGYTVMVEDGDFPAYINGCMYTYCGYNGTKVESKSLGTGICYKKDLERSVFDAKIALYNSLPDEVKSSTKICWDLTTTGIKEFDDGSDHDGPGMECTMTPHVADANPSAKSGTYGNEKKITLTNNDGSKIYYTLDGTDPTTDSTLYAGEQISITKDTTLKLIARGNGMVNSQVKTYNYKIKNVEGVKIAGSTKYIYKGRFHSFNGFELPNSYIYSSDINWSVENNLRMGTSFNSSSVLIIDAQESADSIKVIAASKYDSTKTDTCLIKVIDSSYVFNVSKSSGWDDVYDVTQDLWDGDVINVASSDGYVPEDILETINNKDITLNINIGNDLLWCVNGKNITLDFDKIYTDLEASDKVHNEEEYIAFMDKYALNLTAYANGSYIDKDLISSITGESKIIEIKLAASGDFGCKAYLNINAGKDMVGKYANLMYHDETSNKLVYQCAVKIGADGIARVPFNHASQYALVISDTDLASVKEISVANIKDSGNTITTTKDVTTSKVEGPKTGDATPVSLMIVILVITSAAFAGVVIKRNKKIVMK